ncbi:MAG: peptide deformylase [Magnetovibrio sp.]|nr:peptide deformylase [Magnetovibrio sp.]|tara:strand:+ start:643 stop:1185 length:543 start_codon:yes stop_codon:yes gene_type:complete
MAILKIARMGHPVLMQRAREVPDPTDPAVHSLINDMAETMFDAPGIGLAAPQVHIPARIVVFHIPDERCNNIGESIPLTALINPQIKPLCDEIEDGIEGCLSLPEMVGTVPRYKRIFYKAELPDGNTIEREAEGYHARVVQHECDHLDGILYPMRMNDISKLGYSEEMAKAKALEELSSE